MVPNPMMMGGYYPMMGGGSGMTPAVDPRMSWGLPGMPGRTGYPTMQQGSAAASAPASVEAVSFLELESESEGPKAKKHHAEHDKHDANGMSEKDLMDFQKATSGPQYNDNHHDKHHKGGKHGASIMEGMAAHFYPPPPGPYPVPYGPPPPEVQQYIEHLLKEESKHRRHGKHDSSLSQLADAGLAGPLLEPPYPLPTGYVPLSDAEAAFLQAQAPRMDADLPYYPPPPGYRGLEPVPYGPGPYGPYGPVPYGPAFYGPEPMKGKQDSASHLEGPKGKKGQEQKDKDVKIPEWAMPPPVQYFKGLQKRQEEYQKNQKKEAEKENNERKEEKPKPKPTPPQEKPKPKN